MIMFVFFIKKNPSFRFCIRGEFDLLAYKDARNQERFHNFKKLFYYYRNKIQICQEQ